MLMSVSETSSDEHEQSGRKELVDRGAVRAVIRLSRDLYPVSSVDTTVWVLEHRRRRGPQPRIVMVDATSLKLKSRERERPVLAGAEQISALVRDPFDLVPGESRSVVVEHAIGLARTRPECGRRSATAALAAARGRRVDSGLIAVPR